jgi:hypothetical protein
MLQQSQLPVTFDNKKQYLTVHAILTTLKTDGTRRTAGRPYSKQQELKFTLRTEQWNSSLLTGM